VGLRQQDTGYGPGRCSGKLRRQANDPERCYDPHYQVKQRVSASLTKKNIFMDLQQIFSEAIQLHMQGQLEPAKQKYQQVLMALPGNVNVLGNLGIVCRDLGQIEEALNYCQQAVADAPQDPTQHLNLGAVYEAANDLVQARRCYEKSLELAPAHPKALNNLGKIMHLQGETAEALAHFNRALAVEPDYPLALNNAGVLLSEQGDHEHACEYLSKSHELDPNNSETLYNLAGVYNCLEQSEEACKILEKLLALKPEHASANHMLAALQGGTTDAAPREYIIETFDRYAGRFDDHLQGALGYDVPLVLAEMISQVNKQPKFKSCLDLGCGTGLSGSAFVDLCQSLTGVDLSRKMLDKARKKEIYDRLVCEDVLAYLVKETGEYDLFLATDLFIYMGRLEGFFQAVKKRASHGAVMACSIERHDGDEDYVLRNSGRYAQRPDYLVAMAENAGFKVLISREHGIRKEKNQWIDGNLYIFEFI
jgi:predicted TPR repeat methyltransferase